MRLQKDPYFVFLCNGPYKTAQIPSSPEEVEKKTLGWLKKNSENSRGRTSREGEIRSDCGRFLDGAKDDVVTSGLSTPEEVRTDRGHEMIPRRSCPLNTPHW